MSPLTRPLVKTALAWCGGAFLVGAGGGAVRLLPWLLHPEVPLAVALPFARSLGLAALEVALLVGWPVGWALAAQERSERGEVRVLALLGEGPLASLRRLSLPAFGFAVLLAASAWLAARDATAPGRVAQDLVDQAASDCARAGEPSVRAVPFVGMTWLCAPPEAPRVLAQGLHGATFTAHAIRLSPDLRSAELEDATFAVRGATVRVQHLSLRGLPPFGTSARLAPAERALALGGSGAVAAVVSLFLVFRGRARTRLHALALGAIGPLVALGALRAIDRGAASPALAAAVPGLVGLAVLLGGTTLSRLRQRNPAVRTSS